MYVLCNRVVRVVQPLRMGHVCAMYVVGTIPVMYVLCMCDVTVFHVLCDHCVGDMYTLCTRSVCVM